MMTRERNPLLFVFSALALLVAFSVAWAQDDAPLPAVSDINAKLSFEGGTAENFRFNGSLTMPLGDQFGLQLDGEIGPSMGMLMSGVGAHAFFRDPSTYLLGAYASAHTWDSIKIYRLGVEGEIYADRLTFGGLLGVEAIDVPATKGGRLVLNRDSISPLAVLELSVYPTDNVRLTGGFVHENRQSFGTIGIEAQLEGAGTPVSVFANGRSDFSGYHGVTAGFRVQLGGEPGKALIRRHREDDPQTYSPVFPTLVTRAPRTRLALPGDEEVSAEELGVAAGSSCEVKQAAYSASLPDGGGGVCTPGDYRNGTCGSCVSNGTPRLIYNFQNVNLGDQCYGAYQWCSYAPASSCNSDTKTCRNGAVVGRDGANNCSFYTCPAG